MTRPAALFCLAPLVLAAAEPKPETFRAFDRYLASVSAQQQQQRSQGRFLWSEGRLEIGNDALREGKVFIERLSACDNGHEIDIPGGMVHDWTGVTFIPRATLDELVALLHNADRHKDLFRPEVIGSKFVSGDGERYVTSLRLLKKKVLTVVLDTIYDNRLYRLSPTRARIESQTSSVREVENHGKPNERPLAPGQGQGFLWSMRSSWNFEQKDGGVYVEVRSVSLSRDIPFGLGAIIRPFLESIPRESLCNTLNSTRNAILGEPGKKAGCEVASPARKSARCS